MAANATPDIRPLSENSVLLTFGHCIDPALSSILAAWCHAIQVTLGGKVTDLVPSYTTITVYYDLANSDFRSIVKELRSISLKDHPEAGASGGRQVELPVWYDPSVGPDLEPLARACKLNFQQVIDIHTGVPYKVYALGFSPGFSFMGQVDQAIAHPRLKHPRARVPQGSVGIADRQTAVYPTASPGGWQLIGRCPTPLFCEEQLALLAVGDTVHFHAISHKTFLSLGGDDTPYQDIFSQ